MKKKCFQLSLSMFSPFPNMPFQRFFLVWSQEAKKMKRFEIQSKPAYIKSNYWAKFNVKLLDTGQPASVVGIGPNNMEEEFL